MKLLPVETLLEFNAIHGFITWEPHWFLALLDKINLEMGHWFVLTSLIVFIIKMPNVGNLFKLKATL